MAAIRMLPTQNVRAPDDHISGRDSPAVQWLKTLESLAPSPARPPWLLAPWQVCQGENATNSGPNN